jgi:hypothetical protein
MRFLRPKVPSALRVVDEPSLAFEELLVKGDWDDDCHCACSSDGCTPFTNLLKAINRENIRTYGATSEKPSELRRLAVRHLESPGHPASSAPMLSKVVEIVIRFEALQLSHTCCDFNMYRAYGRYTPKDVREIHEEWEELLSKHKNLVSEFCRKFQELGGTMTAFLKGYWQTRMEEMFKEEKPLDEEGIRRLREIGVVLKEASEVAEEDFVDEDVTDEEYGEEYNEEEYDQGIQAKVDGGSDVGSEAEYASARSESSEQEAGG